MRLTIFGASGKVGRQLVSLALSENHQVTALVHHSNPFRSNPQLQLVSGDVNDETTIRRALAGSEAVISSLGSWHTKNKDVLSQAMAHIIPTMEQAGIKRLITLTGSGALAPHDNPSTLERLNHALLRIMAPKILSDGEEHLRLLEASSLDWTCIRSPLMTRRSQDSYSLRSALASPFAIIPRPAVVRCLLDQLSDSRFIGSAPVIYHKVSN